MCFVEKARLILTMFMAIEFLKHQKHQNSWQVAQIKCPKMSRNDLIPAEIGP